MAEPALDFQRLRALLPQVADGLDAPLPPGPREEAWSGACRELGELSLSFRTADFQAVDWAGCAALMREAAVLAPSVEGLLSQLQALPENLERLASLAHAAAGLVHGLGWLMNEAKIGTQQQGRAARVQVKPLPPATCIDVARWSAGALTAASHLLLEVARGGTQGIRRRWEPAGLLRLLTTCVDTADELRNHMRATDLAPHVRQLWSGVARPEVHGAFAHAALQLAAALHPLQGMPDHDLAATSHSWAVILDYFANLVRRHPPRELTAWLAVDPAAMETLGRLTLSRLDTLTQQARRPLPADQVSSMIANAEAADAASMAEEEVEALKAAEQRCTDYYWAVQLRSIDVLANMPATRDPVEAQLLERWQPAPGSLVARAADVLAALPGRLPSRVAAGRPAQHYCQALVDACLAAVHVLEWALKGGQLALHGMPPQPQLLDALASRLAAGDADDAAVAAELPRPQHWPHFLQLAWAAMAALPRVVVALTASREVHAAEGVAPLQDAVSNQKRLWEKLFFCARDAVWAFMRRPPAGALPSDPCQAARQVRQLLAAAEAMMRLAPKLLPMHGNLAWAQQGMDGQVAHWLSMAAWTANSATGAFAALAAAAQQRRQRAQQPAAADRAAQRAEEAALRALVAFYSTVLKLWLAAGRPPADLELQLQAMLAPGLVQMLGEGCRGVGLIDVLPGLAQVAATPAETRLCVLASQLIPAAMELQVSHFPEGVGAPADRRQLVESVQAMQGTSERLLATAAQQLAGGAGGLTLEQAEVVVQAQAQGMHACANMRCTSLEGGGEAALRRKACAGCGAVRYCCTACQKADWREGGHNGGGHKAACPLLRRLSAAQG